jgi:hypothetical protein
MVKKVSDTKAIRIYVVDNGRHREGDFAFMIIPPVGVQTPEGMPKGLTNRRGEVTVYQGDERLGAILHLIAKEMFENRG